MRCSSLATAGGLQLHHTSPVPLLLTAAPSTTPMSTPTSKRVFLLGPSHHAYTRKCCLSTATAYDTPLGEAELPAWLTRHCLLACSIHCSRGGCCCNMLGEWWG
jgi:hypothetical protein